MAPNLPPPYIFRIFLLEDEDELRTDLRDSMLRKLKDTEVVTAACIEEAERILKSDKQGFTIGVLDIRVPKRPGLQPEAHPEIANFMRDSKTPAIFITGYRGTDDVQEYLRKRNLVDPPVAIVEKRLTPGYLTGELYRHIHGLFCRRASAIVCSLITEMFGVSTGFPRSGTAMFIDVQFEINAYWDYLDSDAKQLIEEWFVINSLENGEVELTIRR